MSVWPSRLRAISFMSCRRMRGLSALSIFLKSAFTSRCCFFSRSVAFIVRHLPGEGLEQDRCPRREKFGMGAGRRELGAVALWAAATRELRADTYGQVVL